MPLMSIEKMFIKDFIKEYKQHDCLWYVKGKDYHDPDKRKDALNKLRAIVKQHFGDKVATKEYVKKKIKNIRTTYRRELNKIEQSKGSGTAADDVYVPRLWYFELLNFLQNKDIPRKSKSSLTDDEVREEEDEREYKQMDPEVIISQPTDEQFIVQLYEDSPSVTDDPASPGANAYIRTPTFSTSSSDTNCKTKAPLRKRNNNSEEHTLVHLAYKQLSKLEDSYDIAGRDYANKLRTLDPTQKIIVEKLVSDAIFEARLNRLKTNSTIFTPSETDSLKQPRPIIL